MDVFYRGRVVNVNSDNVLVHFMDFGNTDPVKKNEVFEIQKEFMDCPLIALSCRLANSSNGWSSADDSVALFKTLVQENEKMNATVIAYDGDVAIVDFQTDSTTVSAVMKEAGFANEVTAKGAEFAKEPTAEGAEFAKEPTAKGAEFAKEPTAEGAEFAKEPAAKGAEFAKEQAAKATPARANAPVTKTVESQPRLKYVAERLIAGEEYMIMVTHCVSPAEIYVQIVIQEVVTAFYKMLESLAVQYSALGDNTTFK
jgi:hypothetical protein